MERGAGVVSVQTLRAEFLWVVAGVGHEDQGLQAWEPRARLAQQPKSISATRFSTFKTASKHFRLRNPRVLISSDRGKPLRPLILGPQTYIIQSAQKH